LLSVLAAIGLTSILILTVLQVGKMVNAQSRRAMNIDDVENIAAQVTNILADPNNCFGIYGGETIDITNIGSAATKQLEVASKAPFAGGDPMNTLESGHMKVTSLGLILKSKVSGTAPLYQGDAVVAIDDPSDPGRFKAKRLALSLQFNSSNALVGCAALLSAAQLSAGAGAGGGVHVTSTGTAIPWGVCPDGQVMIGMTAKGVVCAGSAATSTGKGCTGDNCIASDGGNCYGDNCVANTGIFCDGDNCKACGAGATCTGANCCGGPGCGC
jgi:hypothetical protein